MIRVETKHLFNENTSPFVKSIIMKKRAGLKITEQEERRLQRFNESVSMKEIPKNPKGLVPPNYIPQPDEDELEDMVDLDEILREMGYDESDDLIDEVDEVEEDDTISNMSREELKQMIQGIVLDTMEEEDDLNEIIENLTKNY